MDTTRDAWFRAWTSYEPPIIMENQMEKKMENEMETLGPFKGVYRDYRVVCRDQGHIMSYSLNSLKGVYMYMYRRLYMGLL